MKIAVGADHAGFELKEHIRRRLEDDGHEVIDCGTDSTESTDYPEFAASVARRVAKGEAERGVLCCGTGIGMAMTANKIAGVRAANCNDIQMAELAREHNDANLLTMGGRVVAHARGEEILNAFLHTPYHGGRHQRRIDKISQLDSAASSALEACDD